MLLFGDGLAALDRVREAQAILKREGIVVKDRFGQARTHPAVAIERDARGAMLRAIRACGLDFAIDVEGGAVKIEEAL